MSTTEVSMWWFAVRSGLAFTGGDEGHDRLTHDGLAFLRPELADEAAYWNNEQDSGDPQDDFQRHFDGCEFTAGFAYLDQQLGLASAALDPLDPDPFEVAKQLGRGAH